MAPHAKRALQPSSFKRTLNCPGWGQFADKHKLPSSPVTADTAKGTLAHHLGERAIALNKSPFDWVGYLGWVYKWKSGLSKSIVEKKSSDPEWFSFRVDDALADGANMYVQEIQRKRKAVVGGIFELEKRLSLQHIVPGMFGTGDSLIIEPLSMLYIDDYKNGFWPVEIGKNVGDNPQTTIYALGAIGENNPHDVGEVEATIIQPNAIHPEGPIRSARYSVKQLTEWGNDVMKPAALAALNPVNTLKLKAGEWCKYCPAEKAMDSEGRLLCPAKREQQRGDIEVMFGKGTTHADLPAVNTTVDLKQVPGERLSRMLQAKDRILEFFKALDEEAYSRLDRGAADAPPDFKLVAGNLSNRKWANEEAVYDALKTTLPRKDVFVEKVKSPAQMEIALKKVGKKGEEATEIVDRLVAERTPGKPAMVPKDDPRPALNKVEQMFPDDPLA